ncbi:VOC family protein [Microbacterium sp. DT81.1]|uniref:VOC family protein n=1 Tax=Microbacterium sp. DT81.1 TaxID=3393413 RepID=UPI003CE80CAC
MPIDHLGLGVPDVEAAKSYYDQLMPKLGFQPCFGNGYCPIDWTGAQLFLYEAGDKEAYLRYRPGLQHIAFLVASRAEVDTIYDWVRDRGDEVLHAPRIFPQFGAHYYAVYFLDPHGFKLEVVCPTAESEVTS